jgi:hypothetical protein
MDFYSQSKLPYGVKKERDPIFSKLENDVFSKLAELCKDESPKVEISKNKFVSFEEAIKELLFLKQKEKNLP